MDVLEAMEVIRRVSRIGRQPPALIPGCGQLPEGNTASRGGTVEMEPRQRFLSNRVANHLEWRVVQSNKSKQKR